MSSARSGLALTKDGNLLMVTCAAATMAQFAQIMQALGAVEAMNLDGERPPDWYGGKHDQAGTRPQQCPGGAGGRTVMTSAYHQFAVRQKETDGSC